MNVRPLTVSQLNMYIRSLLEGDANLRSVTVKGEISNFTRNPKSGHMYFTLKDENAAVKVVMFKNAADRLAFLPEDGLAVYIRGRISLYERDGQYQLYSEDIIPDGIGRYHLAFLQLKEKLEGQGLFDDRFKKELLQYPERIGIVTSPSGAALYDVLSILERRYPLAVPVVFPCTVQGEGTAESIIKAIEYFNGQSRADVIIITRGGGSYEDLSAFNDEALARAVFASEIPVISAVGHEVDFTIIDFVADKRAPTPSAAAELAVPDKNTVLQRISGIKANMAKALSSYTARYSELVKMYRNGISIDRYMESKTQRLDIASSQLIANASAVTEEKKNALINCCSKLEAMNPLSVLLRGYSIAEKDGKTVKSVREIKPGDKFTVRIKDGVINGAAEEVIAE